MDIRNWPLGSIMQLPDNCFGRRWPVITCNELATAATEQWISEVGIPDRIVLWGLTVFGVMPSSVDSYWKIALGDHPPADDAEFDAFERIFPGSFDLVVSEGGMQWPNNGGLYLPLRKLLEPNGRRFAYQARNADTTDEMFITFILNISSIPTEVPDCLLSV